MTHFGRLYSNLWQKKCHKNFTMKIPTWSFFTDSLHNLHSNLMEVTLNLVLTNTISQVPCMYHKLHFIILPPSIVAVR